MTFPARSVSACPSIRPKATGRFPTTVALLVLAFFCTVTVSCVRGSDRATDDPDSGNALEVQTFALINQYRENNRLPRLVWDGAIAKVARGHSRDMALGDVDFGHDGFGDRVHRLKSVLTGLQGAGENVLMTDNPDQAAQQAVALWLRSPHHLENIRGNFNYSGLGVWRNEKGVIYFTQIFVKLAPPSEETEAPPPEIVSPFGLLAAPETRRGP